MRAIAPFRRVGQPLKLSERDCLQTSKRDKIVHELGHALGFYHEHQRPDRNEYVEILYDNINLNGNDRHANYDKISTADSLGTNYDYRSIMHYPPYANSINGNATMIIKDSRFIERVRKSKKPSNGDYRQANLFYRCTEFFERGKK